MATSTESTLAPATFTLDVLLAGRICVVEHGKRCAALLLDAGSNPSLKIRPHFPRLGGALDRTTQQAADAASVSFVDEEGRAQALWDIAGCDVTFEGLVPVDSSRRSIEALPDLREMYANVDDTAEWKTSSDLLTPGSQPPGTLTRLSLEGFDLVALPFDANGRLVKDPEQEGASAAVDEEQIERLFLPGDHRQLVHALLRCRGTFKPAEPKRPAVVCKPFDGKPERRLEFEDNRELTLTVTNLCNCVGETQAENAVSRRDKKGKRERWLLDDAEFGIYFELLKSPPDVAKRPLAFARDGGGGQQVAQCSTPARLKMKE